MRPTHKLTYNINDIRASCSIQPDACNESVSIELRLRYAMQSIRIHFVEIFYTRKHYCSRSSFDDWRSRSIHKACKEAFHVSVCQYWMVSFVRPHTERSWKITKSRELPLILTAPSCTQSHAVQTCEDATQDPRIFSWVRNDNAQQGRTFVFAFNDWQCSGWAREAELQIRWWTWRGWCMQCAYALSRAHRPHQSCVASVLNQFIASQNIV